jgi:hypothetical protein
MDLRTEVYEALQRSAGHEELLAIVRRHKFAGINQRQAYETLERLWKELHFDENEGEESPMQTNLEYVLEVVWGFCPRAAALWETSLSKE